MDMTCPFCSVKLEAHGWCIPGTWSFADASCPRCGREFFCELPVGLARKRRHVIDKSSGRAWGPEAPVYEATYSKRVDHHVGIRAEVRQEAQEVVLLNCIDWLYGHSLLKLLNAQRHLDATAAKALILLIPENLRWLVPDEIAQVWTITQSPREALIWNEGLAKEIERLASPFEAIWQSRALSHPDPSRIEVSRFSSLAPFQASTWARSRPAITFIWRDDRHWSSPRGIGRLINAFLYRLHEPWSSRYLLARQERAVRDLFKLIRERFDSVDLAVIGYGANPPGIDHCRVSVSPSPSSELELEWCRRYAASHVVVGVHGSNMLLPSVHAGAVVELIPNERWGNMVQDIIPTRTGAREAIYCYRHLPLRSSATDVAECIYALIRDHDYMMDEFAQG